MNCGDRGKKREWLECFPPRERTCSVHKTEIKGDTGIASLLLPGQLHLAASNSNGEEPGLKHVPCHFLSVHLLPQALDQGTMLQGRAHWSYKSDQALEDASDETAGIFSRLLIIFKYQCARVSILFSAYPANGTLCTCFVSPYRISTIPWLCLALHGIPCHPNSFGGEARGKLDFLRD